MKAVLLTLLALMVYSACASEDEVLMWGTEDVREHEVRELEIQPAIHWHDRYVQDNCARCPDCCVTVTENGFIDPYGVERPRDWLAENIDDSAFCEDCPGPGCICVQDGGGRWWINATLGDE